MPERQIISLPGAPAPAVGVAGQMPGRDTTRALPVDFGDVTIQKRAPGVLKALGGVLQNGQALAQGDIGRAQALSSFGAEANQALAQIGERITSSWESSELAKAEALMKEAEGHFHANAPMDPRDWESSWKEASEQVREDLLGDTSKLTPNLQKKLALNFQAWDASARNSLASRARAHTAALTEQNFRIAYEFAKQSGSIPAMQDAMGAMVSAGVISPEAANMRLTMDGYAIEHDSAVRQAYSQPFEAERALTAGHYNWMHEPDRFRLQKSLEAAKDETRRNEFGAALDWTLTNRQASQSEWLNKVYEIAPHLDASDVEKLDAHRLDAMAPDPARTNQVADRAREFTPQSTEAEKAAFEYDVMRTMDPISARNIIGIMRAASTPDTDPDSAAKKAFAADAGRGFDIIDGTASDFSAAAKKGETGMLWWRTDKYSKFMSDDGKTVDKAKIEAAKFQARDKFISWLRTHPDATQAEKDNEAMKLRIAPPEQVMDAKAARIQADTESLFKRPGQGYLSPWLEGYLEQGGAYGAAINYP